MFTTYMLSTLGGQKRESDSLGLKLETDVSHHVGARNLIPDIYKSSKQQQQRQVFSTIFSILNVERLLLETLHMNIALAIMY